LIWNKRLLSFASFFYLKNLPHTLKVKFRANLKGKKIPKLMSYQKFGNVKNELSSLFEQSPNNS
jgi:hypothetical protein